MRNVTLTVTVFDFQTGIEQDFKVSTTDFEGKEPALDIALTNIIKQGKAKFNELKLESYVPPVA